MAEREGGGSSGWLGFIAGIALLAVIAIGVVAYTGGFNRPQEQAQLEIEAPDIDIETPDID
jgi:amino acid transporter